MIPLFGRRGSPAIAVRLTCIRLASATLMALALSTSAFAQSTPPPEAQAGQIMGTVVDVNGNVIPGATVVLVAPDPGDRRTIQADENGFFKFDDVKPGVAYQVNITSTGFADSSSAVSIDPGQVKILGSVQLDLATQQTVVRVTDSPEEMATIATEQVRLEETQRVLGILPNFYVSYEGDDTAPLTAGMKFRLALRVSHDPATLGGIGLLSAMRQASDSPGYRQGLKGYAERYGATAADGFSDIMTGGAILPSLLHQDPRYFYQGSGTKKSRIRHAMLAPFICKGDNGRWQVNYSSMGGDLASGAFSNLYYPPSDRGAGLVFYGFAISSAERIVSTMAQEFVLGRFTHREIDAN